MQIKEIENLVEDNNHNLDEINNVNMSLEEQNKTIEYMSKVTEKVNDKAEDLCMFMMVHSSNLEM